MRKLLIAGAILVVLVVVVIVVAVMNLNGYLAENRDQLAGMASDALGREVRFERAEVAFSGGLAVRVAGLAIAEDPAFGKADFLTLDDAYVGVRIWPALQGRVEVAGIRLDRPVIRVVQTPDGFNFSSIGGAGDAPPAEPPPPEEEAAGLAVAIAALEIDDGTIYFEDRSGPDGLSLVIDDFQTSGTDLALDGPIAIDFAGRVRSQKQADAGLESRLEGEIRLASLDPVQGTVALDSPTLHPAIFGVRLEEGEGAQVERIDGLAVDVTLAPDPVNSGYPVSIRSQAARLSGLDVDDIAIDVIYRSVAAGSKVDLSKVAIGLAGGQIDLTGDVTLGEPGASPFDLKTKVRDLDTGKLATAFAGAPEGALSGSLGGDIDLAGDSLEWESLKRSLVGNLSLEVGEGALEQVNLLNDLVGGLTTDPGLGQLAATSIRDVAPEALSGDRTPFDGIDMALEILDGAVHARDLQIATGDFAISAIGKVGLDGAVAADGKVRFSDRLTERILKKSDVLEALLVEGEGGKRVELPLRIGGTADSPSVMPDLAALSGKAKDELKNRAAKEITEAIFGKRRDDDGEEKKSDRDSAEDALREGLGRFLGR